MKPLSARPHTVWIEDELWAQATSIGSARTVVNEALRGYLTDTSFTQMDTPIATSPTVRPVSKKQPTLGSIPGLQTGKQFVESKKTAWDDREERLAREARERLAAKNPSSGV